MDTFYMIKALDAVWGSHRTQVFLIMGELKSSREFLVRTEKGSLKSDETRLINPIVL